MRPLALLLALLSLPVALASSAYAQRDAAASVARAVVMVYTDDAALRPLAGCSGFMVDRSGLVVTVARVLRGAAFVTVLISDAREVSAEAVGVDADNDLAVLRVARPLPTALPIGTTRRVAEGTPVLVTGYPIGTVRQEKEVALRATAYERVVQDIGAGRTDQADDPTALIRLDLGLEWRAIGAPVTLSRGDEVLGVLVGDLRPERRVPSGSQTVMPAAVVQRLLDAVRQGTAEVPPSYVTTKLTYERADDLPAWLHARSLPVLPEEPETTVPLPDTDLPDNELPLEVRGGRMLADPRRPRLYVTEERGQSLTAVNTDTLAIEKRLHIGPQPVGMALSPDGKTLFVALSGANQVAVVDAETLTIRERWRVGFVPHEAVCVAPGRLCFSTADESPRPRFQVVDPERRLWTQGADVWRKSLFAAMPGNRGVLAANTAASPGRLLWCDWLNDALQPYTVASAYLEMSSIADVHVSPDGRKIYLCGAGEYVLVLDSRTFATIQELHSRASHAVPSPDGRKVFVTCGLEQVRIFNAATCCAEGYIQTRGVAHNVVVSADGRKLIVQLDKSVGFLDLRQVAVRPPGAPPEVPLPWQPLVRLEPDPPALLPIPSLRLPGGGLQVVAGNGKMLRDPLRPRLYVCEEAAGALTVVNTTTRQIMRRVVVGSRPCGLALSPNNATLYVGLGGSSRIAVLDADTVAVRELLQLDLEPYDLACPTPDRLYATGRGRQGSNPFCVVNPLQATYVRSGGLYGNCPIVVRPGRSTFLIGQVAVSPAGIYQGDAAGDPIALTKCVRGLQIGSGLQDLRYSADGRVVYVASSNTYVQVLDGDTFAETRRLKIGAMWPRLVAPALDGRHVYVTTNSPNHVDVCDASSGDALGSFTVKGTVTGMTALSGGALALQFADGLWLVDPAHLPLEPLFRGPGRQ